MGGEMFIEANSGILLYHVFSGGGSMQFSTLGTLDLREKVNGQGVGPGALALSGYDIIVASDVTLGGGDFSSTGHSFTTQDKADIRTYGGSVVLAHDGDVTIGETIQTAGGDFSSIGNGSFRAVDHGSYVDTGGGDAFFDHRGTVRLLGGLQLYAGTLELTLHLNGPLSAPLFVVRGSLPAFAGSSITVDMDGFPMNSVLNGALPGVVADIITADSRPAALPSVNVVDRALGDAAFSAALRYDLDGTLDLLIQ
jgi:hypothetical protein